MKQAKNTPSLDIGIQWEELDDIKTKVADTLLMLASGMTSHEVAREINTKYNCNDTSAAIRDTKKRHYKAYMVIKAHYHDNFLKQRLRAIQHTLQERITDGLSRIKAESFGDLQRAANMLETVNKVILANETSTNPDPEQQQDLKRLESTLKRLSSGE